MSFSEVIAISLMIRPSFFLGRFGELSRKMCITENVLQRGIFQGDLFKKHQMQRKKVKSMSY